MKNKIIISILGLAYLLLSLSVLLEGMGRINVSDQVETFFVYAGPCAFFLWGPGAYVLYFAFSAVLWIGIIMAFRSKEFKKLPWIILAIGSWIGGAFLSFAISI